MIRAYPAMIVTWYLTVLNIYCLVRGIESWPFTNAPMFAHYVSLDSDTYYFQLVSKSIDGSRKNISYAHVNLKWMVWRLFFKHYYGSADNKVYSQISHDNPQKFKRRLKIFLKIIFNRLNDPSVNSLSLYLVSLNHKRKHIATYHQ